MAQIDELLRELAGRSASDLHITSGYKPFLRQHGEMVRMERFQVLSPDLNREIIQEIFPASNRLEFEQLQDTDFAYQLDGVGRFRVNVFTDRHGIGAVVRMIPSKIPSLQQLGLPPILRDFCFLSKGLVLVVGPTGSGKSTTLAAMIDFINRHRSEHIITIEDPIEFIHEPRRCLVNQREVRSHTLNFAAALRAALREDPDIVLVGEMRDLETMEIAMETAETGHLVFGTLHTNTAASTVDRIIDKFPADRQNQVRTMLAGSLKGVVAQSLCRTKEKGRAAAFEVMVVNNAVASNIRENKTHMIPSAMQMGRNQGMMLFTDSLFDLVARGLVDAREAYIKATDKETFAKKLTDHGIPFDSRALADALPGDMSLSTEESRLHERRLEGLVQAINANPDDLQALNALAWYYATMTDARFRDGAQAVQIAERAHALSQGTNASILNTLGAAYAEMGRFEDALAAVRKGLEIAQAEGDAPLLESLNYCVEMFERSEPVRMSP